MIFGKLYVLPIALFILLLGTFIITYAISVALEHVRPIFPYISDTGTTSPESTIFSQALNMGAVLIYITFYIRCKEVKILYNDPTLPQYSRVSLFNRISLWISLPIAIGASITGNFQETNAIIPHLIGSVMCFCIGLLYFWLHTGISYLTFPTMCTMNMVRLRLLFTIVASVSCLLAAIFAVISYVNFNKSIYHLPKWGPEDGGYELHLVSTISEWITLIFFGLYILTFIKEFKDLALQSPKVEKINSTSSQSVDYGTSSVSINSLDNMNRSCNQSSNGNVVAADLGTGGSKTLLV